MAPKRRKDPKRDKAVKLLDQLIKLKPADGDFLAQAPMLRGRLTTPMAWVLEDVPGDTVVEKCAKIGITRQNYYGWLRGEYRPNEQQAKKLAQITGFNADDIRGRLPAA